MLTKIKETIEHHLDNMKPDYAEADALVKQADAVRESGVKGSEGAVRLMTDCVAELRKDAEKKLAKDKIELLRGLIPQFKESLHELGLPKRERKIKEQEAENEQA
jgi:hypothetical protein